MSAQGSSDDRATFVRRAWRGGRWVLLAIAITYIAIVIYRVPAVHEERISKETVTKIQAQKLTIDDVDGRHLPPPLDTTQANATIAGVDKNGNGIRDEVELAIFAKYPTSTAIRAAELQYAMAMQNELTNAFDSATLVATIQEEGRGYLCISNDLREKEVEDLVFNTPGRNNYRESLREKYMTSFGLDSSNDCDIDLDTM
jgi:hypothetical protein